MGGNSLSSLRPAASLAGQSLAASNTTKMDASRSCPDLRDDRGQDPSLIHNRSKTMNPGKPLRTPTPPVRKSPTSSKSRSPPSKFTERMMSPNSSRKALESPMLERKPWSHVSKPDHEEISAIFHGASGLPSTKEGHPPIPFASIKCLHSANSGVTHATLTPTHCPSWEEMASTQITRMENRNMQDNVLILCVNDAQTKQVLVQYELDLTYLQPFHHYHLELTRSTEDIPTGIRLFVTMYRKQSTLHRDPSSPNYCALEATLRGFNGNIEPTPPAIIAVGRLVPDYRMYKTTALSGNYSPCGVGVTTVTFPNPHLGSFSIEKTGPDGFPELTLPGKPPEKPEWNHPFLFQHKRDNATLFTPGAAIVLEYYFATETISDLNWRLHNPCGFSVLLLNESIYRQLSKKQASLGARVEGLIVQGDHLKTFDGVLPTVSLILRLITSECPDSMVCGANPEVLPTLETFTSDLSQHYFRTDADIFVVNSPAGSDFDSLRPNTTDSIGVEPTAAKPREQWVLKRKVKPILNPILDGEFPPDDAMETILPEYQYTLGEPASDGQQQKQPKPHRTRPVEDVEQTSMNLLDHQMKELDNYRIAVHKMGHDIVALRKQIQDLETQNSDLRRDLAHYDDSTKLMLDSAEMDGLTKPEICTRYVALKQKLASQTAEFKTYKSRVQELQNELIKKNDKEQNLMSSKEDKGRAEDIARQLRDRTEKIKKMEAACRKQEKVIEKMERMLEKALKEKGANEVLLAENKRLRQEIDDLKEVAVSISRPGEDRERLELYQALDGSEGRISTLERQLAENARQWGKEKGELLVKLNEAEHGFNRQSHLVLHDYPSHSFPDRNCDYKTTANDLPRRSSKANGRRFGSPKLEPLRY